MAKTEDQVAGAMAGAIVVGAVLLAVIVAVLAAVTLREILRIYTTRSGQDSPVAGQLKRAFWIEAACLGIGSLLLMHPDTQAVGAYLMAWSALAFVAYIAVLDQRMAKHEAEELSQLTDLEAHLPAHTAPRLAA